MAILNQKIKEQILEIKNLRVRLRWQKYFAMPEDLQNAMIDPPVAEKIWDIISEKYKLADEKVTVVAKIIGLIFLGELPIGNFIGALQKELKIDAPTAQMIAQDINQAIFQPVKESLMAVHNISPKTSMNTAEQKTPSLVLPPKISNFQNPNSNKFSNFNDQNKEMERQREELLNKLKNQQPQNRSYQPPRPVPPPQNSNPPINGTSARPANWHIPKKNVIDLRKMKSKNKYNNFFSA